CYWLSCVSSTSTNTASICSPSLHDALPILEEARELLETTVEERSAAEDALHREEKRLEAVHRATAERREGLVRMAARVESLRGRLSSGDAEITRLREDRQSTRLNSSHASN